jgi:hypothetical protein
VHFNAIAFWYQTNCTYSIHNMTHCSLNRLQWWDTLLLCMLNVHYFGLIQENKSIRQNGVKKTQFI